MKNVIIYVLTAVLIAGCFVGCNQATAETSNNAVSSVDEVSGGISSEDVSSEADNTAKYEGYTAINGHTLRRGLNLSSYRGAGYGSDDYLVDEFTYQNISGRGFDHIRLAADFRKFCDKEYNLDNEAMKTIDTAIELANKNNLVVFLDFHGWYNLNMGKGEGEPFLKIWKSIAERYKDYEKNDMLVFEIINEPHDTEGSDLNMKNLEKLQCSVADAIREISPDRTICFATADSNKSHTLTSLELSYDFRDTKLMEYENIIVAVHIYQPDAWTHQNLEWNGRGGQFSILDVFGLAELKRGLEDMVNFKKETGIPVILGEFGWNTVDCREEDQITYMQTVMDCLNENGIPCTWWGYNNDNFALYRKKNMFSKTEWNDLLVDIMME